MQWILWQLAALGIVLILFNRWLVHWVDGPVKSAVMVTVAVACVMGAGCAALAASQAIQWLPALILVGFSLGEVHRAWLRRTYRTVSGIKYVAPVIRLARPVTTTDLIVSRYALATQLGLPRIRILQLTDFHFSRSLPEEYFDRVLATVMQEAPDVIVLTGDFISKAENLPVMNEWLRRLPSAPLGKYAVLGNHDYWANAVTAVRGALNEHGIRSVEGQCVKLADAAHRRLVLCGTEEPWGPSASLEGVDPNDYVIMLSHTPDNVYAFSRSVDVMLSGHNHGGQFRIPGLGALVVPSRFGRRFDRGQFQVGRTRLFVSTGIGVDAPYLRLYCQPEIIVVDLTS